MNERSYSSRIQEMLISILNYRLLLGGTFYFFFFFLLIYFSGTLTSGFHLTDDHEMLAINQLVNSNGWYNTIKDVITNDLNIRFRPFYFLHRVTIIKIFGTNFYFLSIQNIFLFVITSYFFFYFCIKVGFKFYYALFFPIILFIGPQAAILWRLGPNENIGIFLFSASLFFLVLYLEKKKYIFLILTYLSIIFSTLCKESFVLLLPAFVVLYIWLFQKYNKSCTLLTSIKRNYMLIILLGLIGLSEVIIIYTFVGTNQIGYAGIDNNFSMQKILVKYARDIFQNKRYIFYISLYFLFVLFLFEITKKSLCNFLAVVKKDIAFLSVITFLIIFPQLILYFKSGLFERYYLPMIIGVYFPSFYLINRFDIYFKIKKLSFLLTLSIFLFICFIFLKTTYLQAKEFSSEGNETSSMFSSLGSELNKRDSVLIVMNSHENFEWGYSSERYINLIIRNPNVYFYLQGDSPKNDFEKGLDLMFKRDHSKRIIDSVNHQISRILVLPFTHNILFKSILDSNSNYKKHDHGRFLVYKRL